MVLKAKLVAIGILFLMASVSGLIIPYIILRLLTRNCHSSTRFRKVLGVLNCFSGGVFISTALLTLLPESREKMVEAVERYDLDIHYPFTELLLGVGFLLVFMIENITISCYESRGKNAVEEPHENIKIENDESAKKSTEENGHKCDELCASYQQGHVNIQTVEQMCKEDNRLEHSNTPQSNDNIVSPCLSESVYDKSMSNLHSIVLIIALSIHMIFDGLSVGLLDTSDDVWSVMAALSVHKFLIFLSTGIKIFESTKLVMFIFAMLYMAIVSPIGVGVGIALSNEADPTATGILQAIAVGTFVYVAFFEILQKEFASADNGRILKASSTVFGFALFAGIRFAMPET